MILDTASLRLLPFVRGTAVVPGSEPWCHTESSSLVFSVPHAHHSPFLSLKRLSSSHPTFHFPDGESYSLIPASLKQLPECSFCPSASPPNWPCPQLSGSSAPSTMSLGAASCSPLSFLVAFTLSSGSFLCLILGILQSFLSLSLSLSLSHTHTHTHPSIIQSYSSLLAQVHHSFWSAKSLIPLKITHYVLIVPSSDPYPSHPIHVLSMWSAVPPGFYFPNRPHLPRAFSNATSSMTSSLSSLAS